MKFDASLKDIALFVAVFEERSFTRAADREGATQSGVSQHIRKLEGRLGVGLFIREAGEIRPTPAAEMYYRGCIDLLRGYEKTARDVREFEDDLDGEVHLGLTATFTRSVLAPVLIAFESRHPNVKVGVIETHPHLLAQQVLAGELDFAIVPNQVQQPGLRNTFFIRTPEVLVSAPRSGLEHRKPVALAALGPLKLLMPGSRSIRRQAFDRYFASSDIRITRRLELDVVFTMLDIVRTTDWQIILPALMMAPEVANGDLVVSPLAEPPLFFECSCIEPLRRPLSKAAEAFFGALREGAEACNRAAVEQLGLGSPDGALDPITLSTGRQQVK